MTFFFFPTCHKVGGYIPYRKTTNGSGFAACDKWFGGKDLLGPALNCFGYVLTRVRSDAARKEELVAAYLLWELYTMHFLTLFTKKNVGKSDASEGEKKTTQKNNKTQVPKTPSALSRHLKVKEAGFFYRDGKIGSRSVRALQRQRDVCD